MTFDEIVLIEVSNEVCNKVGGIHGVIASKADLMMQKFPNYLTVGLYNPSTSPHEFLPRTPPLEMENVFRTLLNEGIQAYYGSWKGGRGAPCILLDTHEYMNRISAKSYTKTILGVSSDDQDGTHPIYHLIKRRNWERFRIDSYTTDYFYNEAITWSEAAGYLIELLLKSPRYKDKKVVVIAHEWLSAGVIFRKKVFDLPYHTLFVTHATSHGRADSAAGVNVTLKVRDGLAQCLRGTTVNAYERGVQAPHFTEIAAAGNSDLFASVSQSVAHEATYYLGKAPDSILTNGILMPKKNFSDILKNHRVHKKRIREFMQAVLSPYYCVEEQESLIVMTSGRYEFVNKGFDLYIRALATVNDELRGVEPAKPVYAFMLVPSRTKGLNEKVLTANTQYHRLRSILEPVSDYLKERLTQAIAQNDRSIQDKSINELLSTDVTVEEILKDAFEIPESLIKDALPPIATHDYDYEKDPMMDLCWQLGLRNREEDNVKVMIVPSYLSANRGPLYLSYLDFVNGCDAGIFPSRYEPFGLTPVEAAANGCIAVTSDLSGLGEELKSMGKGDERGGIYVVPLMNKRDDEITTALRDFLMLLRAMPYEELLALKRKAYQLAGRFSWQEKIGNYVAAVEKVVYS
ncbi:MAG: glycosyltransferase [Methanophagales archaeon]|nr:glycosyltransferase [Methanophagales archaeon]